MKPSNNHQKFIELREKHPRFIFDNYTLTKSSTELKIKFQFSLNDCHFFQPEIRFPINNDFISSDFDEAGWNNLAFHLGMIEMLSYWKCACSPTIVIKQFKLNKDQIDWWKKLYYHGLGEFFYLNGIDTNEDDFVQFECESDEILQPFDLNLQNKVLVPVGGGKDSIVSLETLKKSDLEILPLLLNPNPSRDRTVETAGISDAFIVSRTLDKELLKLNDEGYLNGHTPFSALLAFISIGAAILSKSKHIALSNESSANEATDLESGANHQYSKSFEFESDFRNYLKKYIHSDVNYFSFLRPLNELQIAKLFSKHQKHFAGFRSCNAGSKKDIWCCNCSKCLFIYIILAAFLDEERMMEIFGENLLNREDLKHIFNELCGIHPVKPFECVGSYDDVNFALNLIIEKSENHPYLIQYYIDSSISKKHQHINSLSYLKAINPEHFLEANFEQILNSELI